MECGGRAERRHRFGASHDWSSHIKAIVPAFWLRGNTDRTIFGPTLRVLPKRRRAPLCRRTP